MKLEDIEINKLIKENLVWTIIVVLMAGSVLFYRYASYEWRGVIMIISLILFILTIIFKFFN